MEQLQHLLNKVNKVTAYHRHGNKIPTSALDELSNAQIEYEKSFPVDKPVGMPKPNTTCEKNVCANCKQSDKHYGDDICNSPKFSLWNLTYIDIEVEKWGCTFFEQREA